MKPHENNWQPGPCLLTTKKQMTPLLLRLRWNNSAIHYHKDHWCFSNIHDPNQADSSGVCSGKLPHKVIKSKQLICFCTCF